MNGSLAIVGEYETLGAARAAAVESEAILVAPADEVRTEELTAREVGVLELLAEGLPNKAIAARLGISDQTVKVHVASIAGKLGAANRTDVVRRAVRRGLISL
jgi:DNA-binding NarL/FixJ family response regulator